MGERIITQDGGHILLWLRGGRLLVLLRRLCCEAEFGERLFQQLGCQLSFYTRSLRVRLLVQRWLPLRGTRYRPRCYAAFYAT